MSQIKFKEGAVSNNIMVSAEVTALQTQTQVGDSFYVPDTDHFVVLGTAVDETDPTTGEVIIVDGKPKKRSVGQRILAVRMVDNSPIEVQELYIGQIVKRDFKGSIVFPNVLSNALRGSNADAKFKSLVCGKMLVVKEEGECTDRLFDRKTNRYVRNEQNRFVADPTPKRCFRWEPENPARINTSACNKMIIDHVKANYAELLEVEE